MSSNRRAALSIYRLTALCCVLSFVPLTVLWTGCWPDPARNVDEQKEVYFQKGKSLVNSMDYEGAMDAFEKALEVNPRSASAHFELGVLYMQRMNDYAAAIYHFEKHLKLRPDSPLADIVRQRITACKMELAKTVALYLRTPQVQKEFDRLGTENRSLREQVEALQKQLKESESNRLAGASPALSVPKAQAPTNGLASGTPDPSRAKERTPKSSHESVQASESRRVGSGTSTYVVRRGDTFFSIARQHGITAGELQAANPGVRPNRLRASQSLKIPLRKT